MDAEYSARILGSVDPMKVKHIVEDSKAEERSHPSYLSLPEQWEKQVQAIQRLGVGQAFIRLPDDSVHTVTTSSLPPVTVPKEAVAVVRQRYLERYFEPMGSDEPTQVMPLRRPIITRYPG
jgi:hypothetical protein